MTKRLSIALIAVALFVLMAVMPVSAAVNGTSIDAGATVFIGEEGLNLTHAMNGATLGGNINLDRTPTNMTIGWWASGSTATTPDYPLNIEARYKAFTIDQDTFVGRTGNWWLLNPDNTKQDVVFNVQDPQLSVAAWDFGQGKDVTGMNVVQGSHLGIKVTTNMYTATNSNRNNTLYTYGAPSPSYLKPNGESTWDGNYTTAVNGSEIYLASGEQITEAEAAARPKANERWTIRNYTSVSNVMTTYGVKIGTYSIGYWNNSPAVFGETPWTSQNFTLASGLPTTAVGNYWAATGTVGSVASLIPQAATDGFIDLKVKEESGAVLKDLYVGEGSTGTNVYRPVPILKQFVNTQPWVLGTKDTANGQPGYWVTDALVNGQYAYPVGTYSVWAESKLNGMKDNYKNAGADYTGKTISGVGTVTLVSDTVKIEANKDSVVRSKTFSVTITGKASTPYYIWVKNTNTMSGGYDDQPPYITAGQDGVFFEPGTNVDIFTNNIHRMGNYRYENAATQDTIWSNVASNITAATAVLKTSYYAQANTSSSGTRTIGFTTTNWTKAQKYTIRVEQNMPAGADGYGAGFGLGTVKSDEVDINVEKGAVTIVAAGDQSYYLGEEIKFSGTNTETYKTYLFLIGPNLYEYGAQISDPDPRSANVENGKESTFKVVDVNGDNTWSWKWGTATYALDAGTYTIYAASQPSDKQAKNLANAAYGTVSVIIKKPFVSATASQSTVARGDKVFITGTAEGDPSSVAIWIMGKNFARQYTESVNSDSSFSYEIKQEVTKDLTSGQYFVVVQHPMQNKVFDVDLGTGIVNNVDYSQYVVNKLLLSTSGGNTATTIFKLLGANSLQGSDAAEALAEGINNANVDDTYTKLQFLVEEPTIRIDAIGDKHVGDKFTITAQTNLAVDDEILVQVYSSSFKPTQKSQSGEFSGATGTVKVTKGDSGMNKISFDVDSSTFKPDEYIVTEDAVLQTATGTALFNVLETSAKTVAPTAVVTAAPTAAQTAVQTVATTAAPVATTTKASPGFGALIALIGLGAVAFVVVRRH